MGDAVNELSPPPPPPSKVAKASEKATEVTAAQRSSPERQLPTAVCFDERHELHAPVAGLPLKPENYLELCHEIPDRATALFSAMGTAGLLQDPACCMRVEQREATTEELCAPAQGGAPNNSEHFRTTAVHADDHVAEGGLQFADPASYLVDGTDEAARVAAGGVLAVTRAVCMGQAANAFAVVRPPGHHACTGCGCVQGFCVYNNVAVAAANARRSEWYTTEPASVPSRILIIDFDVHHGDGVQQIFYRDAGVCYISIHRGAFDGEGLETEQAGGRGKGFFPGTGLAAEVGDGPGLGLNVNIPFENTGMGDAQYQLAFDTIVMPIARQFAPDLVFVCAGFDAAAGDKKSKAEFNVTASCFGWMVRQAMTLGRVVLALEGGYDIPEICAGGVECLRALQGVIQAHPADGELEPEPTTSEDADADAHKHAATTLRRVVEIQSKFWKLHPPRGICDDAQGK
jgi:histone deacetylase 6